MENNLTFTAEYFLNGEHTQSQLYSQTFSDRVVSVHQQSVFRLSEEKDSKLECSFTINPAGYTRAEIYSTKRGSLTSMRVRKIDENKLEICCNSVFKEIIETNKNETILFDGPSPLLNNYNFLYFVNSNENESIQKTVYFLDLFKGRVLKENYAFFEIRKQNLHNEEQPL